MKRLFFCITMISLLLTGCGNYTSSDTGTIKPMSLSKEQEKIVGLLSAQQEILLFDYDSKREYTHFEVWVEIYRNGELVEPKAATLALRNEPKRWNGQLAVVINDNPDYQWILASWQDGVHASTVSERTKLYSSDGGKVFGPITEPAAIEEGKEILLYSALFSMSDGMSFYNGQKYLEQPELLKEYPYAHLIKCKFYNGAKN